MERPSGSDEEIAKIEGRIFLNKCGGAGGLGLHIATVSALLKTEGNDTLCLALLFASLAMDIIATRYLGSDTMTMMQRIITLKQK